MSSGIAHQGLDLLGMRTAVNRYGGSLSGILEKHHVRPWIQCGWLSDRCRTKTNRLVMCRWVSSAVGAKSGRLCLP